MFGQVNYREDRKKKMKRKLKGEGKKFIGVFGWIDLWKKNG